ncbi:MAG: FkbM family methyltransferase [Hyphomonadaceae bacterium]
MDTSISTDDAAPVKSADQVLAQGGVAPGGLEQFIADIEPFFYRRNVTYVDVGAFQGAVFAKLLKSNIAISEAHLVEPNPDSFAVLKKEAERAFSRRSLNLYNVALSSKSATLRFKKAKTMTQVIEAETRATTIAKRSSGTFTASATTLDEMAKLFTNGAVSLLKIDVEGHEADVLAGAQDLLAKQKIDVLYIEAGADPESTQQCYYRVIDDMLMQHRYRLFRIYEQTHEWMEDAPLLRRMNMAYFSERFAESRPLRLIKELFAQREESRDLKAALITEQAKGASLRRSLEKAEQHAEAAQETVEKAEQIAKEAAQLEKTIARLNKRIEQVEAEAATLTQKIENRESTIAHLRQEIAEHKERAALASEHHAQALVSQAAKAEAKLAGAIEKREAIIARYDERIALAQTEAQAKVREAGERLEALEREATDLRARVPALETGLAALRDEHAEALRHQAELYQVELAERDALNGRLTARLQTAEGALEGAHAEHIARLNALREQAERAAQTHADQIAAREAEAAGLAAALRAAEAALASAQAEHEKQAAHLNGRIQEEERRRTVHVAERDATAALLIDQLHASAMALEHERAEHVRHVAEAESLADAEIAQLRARIAERDEALEAARRAADALERALAAKAAEIEASQAAARSDAAQFETRLRECREIIDALRADLLGASTATEEVRAEMAATALEARQALNERDAALADLSSDLQRREKAAHAEIERLQRLLADQDAETQKQQQRDAAKLAAANAALERSRTSARELKLAVALEQRAHAGAKRDLAKTMQELATARAALSDTLKTVRSEMAERDSAITYLRTRAETVETQLENAVDAFRRLAANHSSAKAQAEVAQAASRRADDNRAEVQQQLDAALKTIDQLQGDLRRATSYGATVAQQRNQLAKRIAAMEASTSWRLTAPLRQLKDSMSGKPSAPVVETPIETPAPAPEPVAAAAPVVAPVETPPSPAPAAAPQPARPTIKQHEANLWGGFSRHALAELEAIKLSSDASKREIGDAAWTLASWYAAEGALERAHENLKIMRGVAKRPTPARVLLEAFCLTQLGKRDAARPLLEEVAAEQPDNLDVKLALANALPDDAARLALINDVYARFELAPVRKADAGKRLAVDNLIADALAPAENATALVSIIMPLFNAAATIGFALDGLLAQTWRNIEIIAVDDASSDETFAILEAYAQRDKRVRPMRQSQNQGAYAARNLGLTAAKGAFITVHDANDWSHPQKIERQARHLIANENFIGNHSNWARVVDDLVFVGKFRRKDKIIDWNPSSFMFRRSLLDLAGGWDRVRVSADAEFFRRAKRASGAEIGPIPEVAPLAFALDSMDSLTKTSATHGRTISYGVRREYHEAANHWRASAEAAALNLKPQRKARPFPVPASILPEPTPATPFDVLYIGDFNLGGDAITATLREIDAAAARGRRVGVLQWRLYGEDVDAPLNSAVRDRALRGRLHIVTPGDAVSAEIAVVATPAVLAYAIDLCPRIEAAHVRVMSDRGPALVNEAEARTTLKHVFGTEGVWAPAARTLRDLMQLEPS